MSTENEQERGSESLPPEEAQWAAAATASAAAGQDLPASGVWSAPVLPQPEVSKQLRSGTLLWGLIMVLIGMFLIGTGAGLRIDPLIALVGLLLVAGVGMIGTAFLPSRKSN